MGTKKYCTVQLQDDVCMLPRRILHMIQTRPTWVASGKKACGTRVRLAAALSWSFMLAWMHLVHVLDMSHACRRYILTHFRLVLLKHMWMLPWSWAVPYISLGKNNSFKWGIKIAKKEKKQESNIYHPAYCNQMLTKKQGSNKSANLTIQEVLRHQYHCRIRSIKSTFSFTFLK